MNQLYFDLGELRKGNIYNLQSGIKTDEGHSFEIDEWIGRGGNASVFKGKNRSTGEECALKFLMHTNTNSTKRFLREVKLLRALDNDHIIKYIGSGRVCVTKNKSNKEISIPFVVMELADCNLQEMIELKGRLPYEQYAGQFRGLAGALATLHKNSEAVHRDIKPENILIVGDRWLLADYGLCSIVTPSEDEIIPDGKNIGPKYWMSPEAHNLRLGAVDCINSSSDVFQLASIFWYVVTGRHPSGVVIEDDWTGPKKLFEPIYNSLFHNYRKRPKNGDDFFERLERALSS
tara:strand:- start:7626 stop:8495 length:870 start_codon:yes stop_codon:yes gene_type:complete